jgi:hypothetical protein
MMNFRVINVSTGFFISALGSSKPRSCYTGGLFLRRQSGWDVKLAAYRGQVNVGVYIYFPILLYGIVTDEYSTGITLLLHLGRFNCRGVGHSYSVDGSVGL